MHVGSHILLSTKLHHPFAARMGYLGPEACKGLEVHVEKPMVIKPAVPRERSTVFLHNIDQQVFFHVEMLYMYDVSSPEATGDAVDTLREALSKALVPYYFAAGRLRVNEEEGRLELDCNGEGALFAGAYCDSSLADLGDLRVPNPDFRKLLVYPTTNVKEIADLPLFTVQVTRFKCGGVIVGIYTSHVAFDGVSGSQFFHDFARAARGEKITFNPSPDRTSLRARCPPCPSYSHPELIQLPDVPAKLLFNPASYDVTAPPKYSFKTFSFSLPMLNALKEKALADGSISKCSTFEALTAHLWRARFKAMEDDPQKIAKLFVAMNFRDKLKNPPLPKNFTGNAVIGAPCVDTTVQELCVEKPFSFCVRKVQEAIGLVNDEYIRSEMDWIDAHKHGIINVPGGMIITSWNKLPFHELDFGWGKPTYVAPPVNDRPEYVLVLSSCKGDGEVDVFMAMDFNKMAKLEKYVKDF